jgi:guanine deaminase
MDNNKYMQLALDEASKNLDFVHGGPFGCVIVKDGKVVATAHNEVLKTHDPTAHAEILAIRRAGEFLGTHDLSNCTLYTSCEPCPMCYSAIYWSRIKSVYFSADRKTASRAGFDDGLQYEILAGEEDNTQTHFERILEKEGNEVFDKFNASSNKKLY